jgi:8-oxo-dGTP pyrophosphatase MutT (NUDIX family)
MKTTCGLLLIFRGPRILMCHPTGDDENVWSMPKGLMDEGELPIETAFRETLEETGLDVPNTFNGYVIHPEIERKYETKKKKMIAFPIFCENEIDVEDLHCSTFLPELGIYEVDDFKLATWDEAMENMHPTQVSALQEIESLVKNHI